MEPDEYQRMRAAEEWHWWYAGLHDLALRLVRREAARAAHPPAILDAGCGTGRLAALLQPFGPVTACDLHPLAIAATAERGLPRVLRRDVVTDDLGSSAYDVIVCFDVLYHSAVRDDSAALRNVQRALKPGGLFLVQVPAFACLHGAHDVAVHTRHRYRRNELARVLTAAGFAIEFATYRLPLCFLPVLLWRQLSRRRPAAGAQADTALSCPPLLNHWLAAGVRLENRLLLSGWRFPCGLSVFVSARKKAHTGFLATGLSAP